MKKVFLLIMVAVLGMATANAQWYLGGSLGFRSNTYDPDVDGAKKGKVTAFSIVPEIGYSLTDKVDLGISIGFTSTKFKDTNVDFMFLGEQVELDGVKEFTITGWEVAPYIRYNLVQFGNFSLLGKASIDIEGGKMKNKIEGGDDEELKYTAFGFNIKPVLKYTLSEKFDLLADLNFLSLGFNQTNVKDGATVTDFGLNVDSNDVANIGGGSTPFTIGFAFKF